MKIWTTLLALPLVLAACSERPEGEIRPATGTIEVSIGSGPKIDINTESMTRTALGPDGEKVTWVPGDKIAFWAVDAQNQQAVISGAPFTLLHYNTTYNTARFTGTVQAMTEGTYDYYAVAPVPAAINDLKATFLLPAVQTGEFTGDYDVMIGTPVKGMSALKEGDNSGKVNFLFKHKTHVLKITIPTNQLGEKISEIELIFPKPVVGRMTFDIDNPDGTPELTESSNTLMLHFDEPKDGGEVVYAFIAPVNLDPSEPVKITALGETCESEPREFAGKNFAESHTTPVTYNIPAAASVFTRLKFTLENDGESTLGEKIDAVILTAPDGSSFDKGSKTYRVDVDEAGDYIVRLREAPNNLSNQPIAVTYDSEHAALSGSFTMPPITAETLNDGIATLSVPFLLFETFDNVTAITGGNDNATTNNPAAIWLDAFGLPGWSAARIGSSAGLSVRLVAYRRASLLSQTNYMARMDSAPLSGIKPGKNVKIDISFNYSGTTTGNDPKLRYGVSTTPGAINGQTQTITPTQLETTSNTTGSYTNITQSISFTPTCTNESRIAWVVYGDNTSLGTSNNTYTVYIDNVKATIAKSQQ